MYIEGLINRKILLNFLKLEPIKCSGISCELFSNAKAFSNSERFERLSLSGCETITKFIFNFIVDPHF